MKESFVSIVLPVYNQADHITQVVEQYENALSKITATRELILVVNGSKDNSLEICYNLQKKYSTLKIIHSQEGGWGRAVKLGLKEAQGEIICYTNSARTSAAELRQAILYALDNPGTVIKANRKVRSNLFRMLGSYLFNFECRFLFDLTVWDINGTPKVFPRQYDYLRKLSRDDDLIDLEFNFICKMHNYPMLEVPIFSSRRHNGRSTTGWYSALGMYLGVFSMWCERKKNLKDYEQTLNN